MLGGSQVGLGTPALADLERHHGVRLLELGGAFGDPVFELVAGGAQLVFDGLELGDVELDAQPVLRAAVVVADQRRDVAEPDHPAVVRDQPVLAAPGAAGLVVQVVGGQDLLAVVGMQELHPDVGLAEPLVTRVPQGGLDVRADVHRPAVVVGGDLVDDRGEVLDEGAVPSLVGVLEALRPRPGALASVGPVRHEVGPWCQKQDPGNGDAGAYESTRLLKPWIPQAPSRIVNPISPP